MREVAVFCLDVDATSVRITETARHMARRPRSKLLSTELPLKRVRKTHAGQYREGLRIATRYLEEIIDRHLGKARGVAVIVDRKGLEAIEGRDQCGLMQLFRDMPLTIRLNYKSADNHWVKGGGLPFDLGERSNFRGFVSPDGIARVLEFGIYNRGMVTSDDGWSIVPLDLRLEWKGPASPAMIEVVAKFPGGPVNSAHESCRELQRLFFTEVSPTLTDPFVRQKPLYICAYETESMKLSGYSQGPAKLDYRRGNQAELAKLIRCAAIIAANGTWAADYRGQISNWKHLSFKMIAAGQQRDARLVEAVFVTLQPGLRNLLTVILEIMNPKGNELGQGFKGRYAGKSLRVSKASKRPATFYCRVTQEDLESVSAHDQLLASAELERFLTANGLSAEAAIALIEDV